MHIKLLVVMGLVFAPLAWAAQNPSIPKQFQGKWAGSLDKCKIPHEGALTIGGDRIDFYESRGRVLAVRSISTLEVEIDLELRGEGQIWRATQRFALSEDRRTLTDPTNTDPVHKFLRVRCS
jgi:hypothetical protein